MRFDGRALTLPGFDQSGTDGPFSDFLSPNIARKFSQRSSLPTQPGLLVIAAEPAITALAEYLMPFLPNNLRARPAR